MGPDGPVDPSWHVDGLWHGPRGRGRMIAAWALDARFSIVLASLSRFSVLLLPLPSARLLLAVARVTPHSNLSLDFRRASRSKIGHRTSYSLTPACVFVLVSLCFVSGSLAGASLQLEFLRSDMGRGERDKGRGAVGQ